MGLNKSAGDAYRLCSLDTDLHADTETNGVTVNVSEGVASEEDEACTRG